MKIYKIPEASVHLCMTINTPIDLYRKMETYDTE